MRHYNPPSVMWKTSHLLTHRGGETGKCVLCQLILHESEGWWMAYIFIAWALFEYGLLHG